MKEKIYLITTPLKETFKKENKNIFLHPWIEENKIKFFDYPNNNQMINNNNYCLNLYEKILPEISTILNKIHKSDFNLEFWKFFLGPWLKIFISILNDRWKRIENFNNNNFYSNTYAISYKSDDLAENSHESFMQAVKTDYWNSIIYNKILKFTNACDIEEVPYKKNNSQLKNSKCDIKNLIKKRQNYLFINTYLSPIEEISINLKLKQFPILRKKFIELPQFNYIAEIRNEPVKQIENYEFEKFLFLNIFKYMPRVFLEGFFEIDKVIDSEKFPKNPKGIFCGIIPENSHVLKYLAMQKIRKTKIITVQMGGDSSYYDFHRSQKQEISNTFLSWCKTRTNKNIRNLGYIKKKFVCKNPEKIVMFLYNSPKYIYKPDVIGYRMYNGYIERIINFIGKLHLEIQNKLLIRIIGHDNWSQKKKILKYYPHIKFSDENTKINEIYKNTKFIISTYLGTTIFEALVSNIPACLLIDENEMAAIDNKQKLYFDILKNINILHSNLNECSDHINNLLDGNNLKIWWNSNETKKNLSKFKNEMCFNNPKLIENIISVVR